MMEEVSTVVGYDAHIMEQLSEEEILACLVAESRPRATVPSKKPKLLEKWPEHPADNSVERWKKENLELQQASLRLEQENDNLAHKLVSSKIALRNALDQAEDRAEELGRVLLQTRKHLQATEEEKRGKEEEAALLKELFHREMEKSEQEVMRSSGIIAEYKQICVKLTERLEKQEAAHREELDNVKRGVTACPHCRHIEELKEVQEVQSTDEGAQVSAVATTDAPDATTPDHEEEGKGGRTVGEEETGRQGGEESLRLQVEELEQELAQTKLQLVQAECRIQELQHQNVLVLQDIQTSRVSWLSRTFTSLRSSGAPHNVEPRDGGPPGGEGLHISPLTTWGSRRLSWAHTARGTSSSKLT